MYRHAHPLALLLFSLPAIAAHPCSPCHPAEVKSYAATGMGLSISHIATQPAGTFTHQYSNTTVSIAYEQTTCISGSPELAFRPTILSPM